MHENSANKATRGMLRGGRRGTKRLAIASLWLAAASASACREDAVVVDPGPDMATLVPARGRSLDRSNPDNAGLITNIGPDGLPVRQGDLVDPMVIEARRFYDTIQSPNAVDQMVDYPDPFTGAAPAPHKTAPLTFEAWKAAFGFPARITGEPVEAYRLRLSAVVYYNRNELGLGRELGCIEFNDGTDASGAPLKGLACFVSNYGQVFRDQAGSLAMALQGDHLRNTVCISYRPSLDPGYQVQFYAYGPDGHRLEWAQLDTMGPRPHPQVCINCHGGSYDNARHLAKNARFLPLDPNVVAFAEGIAGRDRASQEEAIRRINAASTRTGLTTSQQELLQELYQGGVQTPGTVSQTSWAPAGWKTSATDMQMFDQVVKPYCTTCHLAIENGHADGTAFSYTLFHSAADFKRFPMTSVLCGDFSMPNAQPTIMGLWDVERGPVTVGGTSYASAADAFLAYFGSNRAQCAQLAEIGSCNRGPDPDSLCGNANSGTACNRVTGRCTPGLFGTEEWPGAKGYCRMDSTRACPSSLQCKATSQMPPGLDAFDGVCATP